MEDLEPLLSNLLGCSLNHWGTSCEDEESALMRERSEAAAGDGPTEVGGGVE